MRTLEIRLRFLEGGSVWPSDFNISSFRKIAGMTLKLCSGCIALDQQRESTKESQES